MLRFEIYHQSIPLWWLSPEMGTMKGQGVRVGALAKQMLLDNVNWLANDLWHPL